MDVAVPAAFYLRDAGDRPTRCHVSSPSSPEFGRITTDSAYTMLEAPSRRRSSSQWHMRQWLPLRKIQTGKNGVLVRRGKGQSHLVEVEVCNE